jgi:hypothetical protein
LAAAAAGAIATTRIERQIAALQRQARGASRGFFLQIPFRSLHMPFS